MRHVVRYGLTVAILLVTACEEVASPPDVTPPSGKPTAKAVGLVEITITGIGGAKPASSARALPFQGARGDLAWSPTEPGTPMGTAAMDPRTLSVIAGGDGSIQLLPVSTSSFTVGTRGTGGYRYVSATFRVRNAHSDGTAYTSTRENLTFIAVSDAGAGGTIGGSAILQMRKFDNSPASTSIAADMVPTGFVGLDATGGVTALGTDVFQAYHDAEVAGLDNGTITALPYGFVVRNPKQSTARTLSGSPDVNQFDGLVTFAYKYRLQASADLDPFTIVVLVLPVDDNQKWVTQTIEEGLSSTGSAAAAARADALDAGMRAFFATSAAGQPAENLCQLRTAGSVGSPTLGIHGASTVGLSPNPYANSGSFIPLTGTFSASLSSALAAPTSASFGVNSFLSGRRFLDGTYTGGTTISTPSEQHRAGEEIEVGLRSLATIGSSQGLCDPRVYRLRVATAGAAAQFRPVATDAAPSLQTTSGDFNGDGLLDLVSVTSFPTSGVALKLATSPSTFGAPTSYSASSGAQFSSIVTGDFNGDGAPDVAIGSDNMIFFAGALAVYLGDESGALALVPGVTAIAIGNLSTGDLNNDGHLDLVGSGHASSPGVKVLLGDGDGHFAQAGSSIGAASNAATTLGDIDSDGDLDIIVGSSFGGVVVPLINDGTASFTEGTSISVTNPLTPRLAHVDGDGYLDLVYGSGTGVHVRLGSGTGTFGAEGPAIGPSSASNMVAVADFDGDGKMDIMRLDGGFSLGSLEVRMFMGDGAGAFSGAVHNPLVSIPAFFGQHVAIPADFNDDGRLDFYYSDLGANSAIHTNVTAPAFSVESAVPTALTTVDVTFGDTPNQAEAETPANYAIMDFSVLSAVPVSGAVLNGNTVTLTTPVQTPGANHQLTVTGVTRAGDPSKTLVYGKVSYLGPFYPIGALATGHTELTFSFPVPAAVNPSGSHFTITGGTSGTLAVTGATVVGNDVHIATAYQEVGASYTVHVTGVTRVSDGAPYLLPTDLSFSGYPNFDLSFAEATSSTAVELTFSDVVDPASVSLGNITIGGLNVVSVLAVVAQYVIVETDPQVNLQTYTVTATGVKKLSTGEDLTNTTADFTGY